MLKVSNDLKVLHCVLHFQLNQPRYNLRKWLFIKEKPTAGRGFSYGSLRRQIAQTLHCLNSFKANKQNLQFRPVSFPWCGCSAKDQILNFAPTFSDLVKVYIKGTENHFQSYRPINDPLEAFLLGVPC